MLRSDARYEVSAAAREPGFTLRIGPAVTPRSFDDFKAERQRAAMEAQQAHGQYVGPGPQAGPEEWGRDPIQSYDGRGSPLLSGDISFSEEHGEECAGARGGALQGPPRTGTPGGSRAQPCATSCTQQSCAARFFGRRDHGGCGGAAAPCAAPPARQPGSAQAEGGPAFTATSAAAHPGHAPATGRGKGSAEAAHAGPG